MNGTQVNATTAIRAGDIVFISCDSFAYPGYQGPLDVIGFSIAGDAKAIILYSTSANTCSYSPPPTDYSLLFTLVGSNSIQSVMNTFQSPGTTAPMAVVARQSMFSNGSTSTDAGSATTTSSSSTSTSSSGSNVTAPSTAVAMIILYSITGVITGLFLIIIITGAIRAHRNPERYGPRSVLGRPRQSRARGLARAMLDTLPIVKFGEREEPKPGPDVELGESASRTHSEPHVDAGAEEEIAEETTMTPPVTRELSAEETEAKTEPETAPTTSVDPDQLQTVPVVASDDALSCSICTEDFERGQDVRVLPCNHNFHPACIDPWLLNVSGTCPLCRIDLRPRPSTDSAHTQDPERSASHDGGLVALPLEHHLRDWSAQESTTPDGFQRASRRFSGFMGGILNARRMLDASPQERVEALRALRARQQATGETELEARRRRRVTALLSDAFSVRTRRRGGEAAEPEPEPLRFEIVVDARPMALERDDELGEGSSAERDVVAEHRRSLRLGVPLEIVVSNGAGERVAEWTGETDGRSENSESSDVTDRQPPEQARTSRRGTDATNVRHSR